MHARTLEFYRQVGLAEAVVERGLELAAVNLWVKGKKAARVVFGAMGQGLSPFPYGLIFPQDQHERLRPRVKNVSVQAPHGGGGCAPGSLRSGDNMPEAIRPEGA